MDEIIFQHLMNAFLCGLYREVENTFIAKVVPMNNTISRSMYVDNVMTSVNCISDAIILSLHASDSVETIESNCFLSFIECKPPFGKLSPKTAYDAKDQLVIQSMVLEKYRPNDILIKSAILDGFAIANLFAFVESSEAESTAFYITNRVIELKSFILHSLWLIANNGKHLKCFAKEKDKTVIKVSDDYFSGGIANAKISGYDGYTCNNSYPYNSSTKKISNVKSINTTSMKKKRNSLEISKELSRLIYISDENKDPNVNFLMLTETNLRKHNMLTKIK
jgi:hypothetical protein